MDNLAHTLFAAAMAKSRLGRSSRFAVASLLVGANLPDLDCVAKLYGGKAGYLAQHRGLSHSLFGIAVGTVALAAVVRWLERRFEPRLAPSWRAHLLPAFAGLLSHLALDSLNNYGVRPWLPFSSARLYGDLVFIVDPWLWLLFGATACLAGARSRIGSATWLAIAAGVTLLVDSHDRTPDAVKWWWPLAVVLLASLRVVGVGRESPRRVLALGGALFVLYLAGLEASASIARRRAPVPPLSTPVLAPAPWSFSMRAPMLGDPLSWRFYFETDDRIAWEVVDVFGRVGETKEFGPRRLDDPRVRAVAGTSGAAAWRSFARLPWAWIDERVEPPLVVLTDGRYDWAQDEMWCSLEVPLRSR